jgi:hypothetical protein
MSQSARAAHRREARMDADLSQWALRAVLLPLAVVSTIAYGYVLGWTHAKLYDAIWQPLWAWIRGRLRGHDTPGVTDEK